MGVFQKQPTSSSPWAVANVQTNDDAAESYRMTTTAQDDEEYYCDDATLASTPSIRHTFEFGSKHTTIVRDCGEPTDIIFGEQTTTSSSSSRRRKRKDDVLVLLKKTVKLLVLVCRFLKRKPSSNKNNQDWYDGFDGMDIQPPITAVLV